jgi:hypothetical protein
MTEPDDTAIDGWPDQQLRATANAFFGLGADSDMPEHVRFLIGVVRAIHNRHQQEADGEQAPAVFFSQPFAPPTIPADDLSSQPMLDTGLNELGGALWFVGPVVRSGLGLRFDPWPADGDLFDHVSADLGLGEVPAVLFEPRSDPPTLRHYPSGFAVPDDVAVVPLGGEDIDLDRVLAVIDTAHVAHLQTSQGGPAAAKLWQNRSKHYPVLDAEARIQFILRVALQGAFPATVVREELPQSAGRLDLEIEETNAESGTLIRHALLELKVLRSYGSTGNAVSDADNRAAVKEGVGQAAVYRDQDGARASALCCFDMRKVPSGTECFKGVRTTAARKQVRLRVWHIFPTAKAYRAAQA